MAQVTYEQVVRLAEQLTREEQQALIAHLQRLLKESEASFDSLKDSRPIVQDFSPRREDWYDDDGR